MLHPATIACRETAGAGFIVSEDFFSEVQFLHIAARQGKMDRYIHDCIVEFRNFTHGGFLSSVSIAELNVDGLYIWAADGMFCSSQRKFQLRRGGSMIGTAN